VHKITTQEIRVIHFHTVSMSER